MSTNLVSTDGGSLLESDIKYDFTPFRLENAHPSTLQLNKALIEKSQEDSKWWEIGANEYRQLRAAGKTPFPPSTTVQRGKQIIVPSRESGREIPCRVFETPDPKNLKGIFLHIHGGGFVLGSAAAQDLLLDYVSRETQLTVVSVEYRLAPEHVFPAAIEDCNDVADWLVKFGREKFGAELNFVGGESAGATLSTVVLFHLRQVQTIDTLKGAVLNYGCFDLSMLPLVRQSPADTTPILDSMNAAQFLSTYLKDMTMEDRKSALVSPAYNDLKGMPPALFLLGTEDALVEDTLLMHFRWLRAGNQGIVKFVPSACHGFMTFDGSKVEATREGWKAMVQFLQERI